MQRQELNGKRKKEEEGEEEGDAWCDDGCKSRRNLCAVSRV